MVAFRSAIAGNEELEKLVYGFQLSDEEAQEPNFILKHLQEHFRDSEGVLTERTKFAQRKTKNLSQPGKDKSKNKVGDLSTTQ